MAGMIFRINHLFLEKNDTEQLRTIAKFYGYEELERVVQSSKLGSEFLNTNNFDKNWFRQSFDSLINKENQKYCSLDAIRLLEQLMKFDHKERITAREAMEHEFFSSRS